MKSMKMNISTCLETVNWFFELAHAFKIVLTVVR